MTDLASPPPAPDSETAENQGQLHKGKTENDQQQAPLTRIQPTTGVAGVHTTEIDSERGIYEKFRVERTDGRSAEGEKHEGCEYFVLDLNHDPFAYAALMAYGRHCSEKFPALADDLFKKAQQMALWMTEKTLEDMTPEERRRWSSFVFNNPERR